MKTIGKLTALIFESVGWPTIVFPVAYWIFDSILDAYVFRTAGFFSSLLAPDPMCLSLRLLNLVMILAFAVIAQRTLVKRKLAEQEARKQGEWHQAILRTAMDGIWLADTQGNLLEVNEAYCLMSGFSKQELLSLRIFDLEVAETADDVAAHIRKIIAQGEDRFESRHRRRDRAIIDVEISAQYKPVNGGLFVAFIRDITERKQREKKLEEALAKLRKTSSRLVEIISSTVNLKDPYTANHQKKVSKLVVAIAKKMGLTAEQISNVQLAASVHDIGKMGLPVEILNKQTALSEIEQSLFRSHVQAGYQILKDADLPEEAIARIVLQHHERLDGSGYPNGLKGEEIMVEAKILAVAGKAEALSSFRPWRATKEIGEVLAEIEKGKGTLFDPAVVEAYLKVFREGFKFD